ncbi:BamA/TamA family outer membrane protein [Acidovorax sp. GBBC 3334]|uniref:autotransporter assembly complex protein TamA n=1 Tax=Acidovorax sp. GBBC 3334 TaxID=2940496 RepID=UPI00230291AA|nr:BamA/TamA family outer membrane protein [Acidovorax sp. GBBC 3334]MDA8453703.1 BamA/TamA family outer membrane protein [Acidovorax sp. GBBC 3334]
MPSLTTAPAHWPALLLLSLVALQGCSLLPGARDKADSDENTPTLTSDAGDAGTGAEAFTLEVRGPDAVRDLLTRHMELQRFRKLPDLQASELSRLLGAAEANARELLATMGYFSPTLTIALKETPGAAAPRSITVDVEPGPRTTVASAEVAFTGPEAESPEFARRKERIQRSWSLQPGQPFTQDAWDGAKADGLRQLQARRYPTARIDTSRAEIDADRSEAQLGVTYAPGPPYRFGALRVQGSERYDPDGARRIARLPTGAEYSEKDLLDAQARLASSGYYDAVFLALDPDVADPQAAPVTAQVRESPLQKVIFGVGISTDSGARLSLDHIHNRMPGLGWRAVTKISIDQKNRLLSTEWTDLPNENGWRWFTGGQLQREETGSYDTDSGRLRGGRTKSAGHIDRSYFLQYDTAKSRGPEAPPSSSAISANYGWTGRYFNNDTSPTRGYGIAAELGVGTTLRPERDPFVRARLRWQSFVPMGRVDMGEGIARNSRLSLRAEGGAVIAREGADIPVTQLFLTGGDTTVRGYGYRKIGARTDNDTLYGGRYLAVGSVEWQRPITVRGNRTDFESAVFVDAGAVADRVGDLNPRVGVGAGLRWRSPVGPLQADIAYGVQAKALRLHLRLGFSF